MAKARGRFPARAEPTGAVIEQGSRNAQPGAPVRRPPPFTFDYAFASADLAARVRHVEVDGAATGADRQPLLLELHGETAGSRRSG